ncbi:MAG: cytochrome c [Deltaproteobacteria bacterium]|nr:MAG: cytochrome c [Deltaproteobacteria bacterium]
MIRACKRIYVVVIAAAAGSLLAPALAFAGDAAAGKKVYEVNCVSCHGTTGKGDGPVGVALDPRPRDFSTAEFKFDTNGDGTAGSDVDLAGVIKNGGGKYGGSPLMAPWAHLPDSDIQNLIAYIRTLKQ